MKYRPMLAMSLLLVFLFSGCGGSGPAKYRVTGEVYWEGEPLPVGDIILEPIDGGMPEHGKIVAGKFDMQAAAGSKKVQILATREGEFDPAMGSARRESYIPAKYNAQTSLDAEVKPSGGNHLIYTLTGGD